VYTHGPSTAGHHHAPDRAPPAVRLLLAACSLGAPVGCSGHRDAWEERFGDEAVRAVRLSAAGCRVLLAAACSGLRHAVLGVAAAPACEPKHGGGVVRGSAW
jgi:hypothetical protein